MLLQSEIDEEYDILDVLVLTPWGYRPVLKAYRTIPLPSLLVSTDNGTELLCSRHHILYSEGKPLEASELALGMRLDCIEGTVLVTGLKDAGENVLYDITVDDPSGLFYSNGILSHNSTTFCARQLIYAKLFPGYKSLLVTPYDSQRSTYGDRLKAMEQAVRYDAGKQNKYTKMYDNGSEIRLLYALESADRIRGISTLEVLVDECVAEDCEIICRGEKKSVDKIVRICDAVVGDLVLCPVLGTDKVTYERITDKQCKGERECWTVYTERGYHVTTTANHKLRSGDRWIYMADILRDIGVRSLNEGDTYGRQGTDESICSKSSYTCHDTRDTAGGRKHTESGVSLLLQENSHGTRRGPERVCCSENADVERIKTNMVHSSKQRIFAGLQYLSFCNYYVSGLGPVLEPMLLQARSFTGWLGADAEVCISGMGRPADLGGGGLVDSGRWQSKWQVLQHINTFIFRGGSEKVSGLVQEARSKQARGSGDVLYFAQEYRENISNHTLFNSSFTESCREDSSVCTSFYGVQVGSGVTVSGLCMPGLWRRVSSYQAEAGSNEVLQCHTLSGVCEEGEEGLQGAVQGTCWDGGNEEALEGRETLRCREGLEVCERVLQAKQGCDTGESKVETLWVLHDGKLIEDRIVRIEYAGRRRVWDITVEPGHVFFSNSVTNSNCQNMNPDLVPEILKTQSLSKSPMTIYSGTALDTSTLLELQWLKSSFGCYQVRSWDGKHWINMHDEEELWKVCDNPTGPIDYWTGKPLNVINGYFEHGNKKALEAGDIGIHIPMPVVLSNCSGTLWAQIYKDLKQLDPKKTLQESFGIAIGDGAREISQADIERCCVLTDSREEAIKKTLNGYYSLVVMGCDWGGSDYNKATNTKLSYTAVTIMGLAPDGVIDVLWSKKYAGMDYRTIVGDFLQQYHTFNCRAIASDFGVGAVYNLLIRDSIPWLNHFVMQYTAPNTTPFKAAANSELTNHYTVNKTEAITNVFQSVKDQKFRFSNWNDMAYYLNDFLHVNRVPYETPSGAKSLRWIRQAEKADDYLHACTFASTLIKVYTGERIVTDKSLLSQILDVLAGRPMFNINDWEPPVISG